MGTTLNKSNRTSEIRAGLIVTAVFVVAAVVILVMVAAREHYLSVVEQEQSDLQQVGENRELRELRVSEDRLLDTVEVVDSAASVYRIPIDHAMELIADEDDK
ncbi:MAG: hypothetical protein V3T31_07740 [candidate division Zixibacteria bacterium]